jgi:glycosyltransferase involved in cell wall biosynthesis
MKKALKVKADIYHYHDPNFMIVAFVMSVFLGRTVVFDIHESVPDQTMSKNWIPKGVRKAVSLIYRVAEVIFTRSQTLIVANKSNVEDYKRKVFLVQNYPVLREDLIKLYDESKFDETPLLVYVGGVSLMRGADVYIELAGRLKQQGYDFKMKIVGWNCLHTIESLSGRIKQLGVEDKVEYTGGMDWFSAMKVISQAHIGLCLLKPIPNYLRCLATKIVEYMMLGVPVIASDFEVWRPYVEGEKTGYMVDPENIEQVVQVCEKMLCDKAEMIRMAQRGIRAVREKYNWNHEFKQLIDCYNTLRS